MSISLSLDANAFDYFFERALDLSAELPLGEFDIFVRQEVATELNSIRDIASDGTSNVAKKQYICDTLDRSEIKTNATFGFAGSGCAGFGQGTFQSDGERQRYADPKMQSRIRNKPSRPTGLTKNEGDAAVAVSSFYSVVLTNDTKSGPIRDAYEQGGKVIFLSEFGAQTLSLKEYILSNV